MIRTVVRDRKFDKSLAAIRKAGKKGALSADKAERVISRLVEGRVRDPLDAGSVTKYGELRMDKCLKFDLGAGYRAICRHEDECLRFLFMGTHDECDRYLETNRGRVSGPPESSGTALAVQAKSSPGKRRQPVEEEPDYDELLLSRLTQKDLRVVFSGLLKSLSRQHS